VRRGVSSAGARDAPLAIRPMKSPRPMTGGCALTGVSQRAASLPLIRIPPGFKEVPAVYGEGGQVNGAVRSAVMVSGPDPGTPVCTLRWKLWKAVLCGAWNVTPPANGMTSPFASVRQCRCCGTASAGAASAVSSPIAATIGSSARFLIKPLPI